MVASGGTDDVGSASTTTASANGGSAAGSGGTAGASSTGGGGGAPPLSDDGLVARYFIDEAAMGTSPLMLSDAAPSPLPLTIHFLGGLVFQEVSDNRALRWSVVDGDDRAAVPVAGTKIANELNGSTTGTMEVVVDVEQLNLMGTRLSHIGGDTGSGQFTLSQYDDQVVRFRMKNSDRGRWPIDLEGRGRTVLHLVFDSNVADQALRARLFENGSEVQQSNTAYPSAGETITMGANDIYAIGNRGTGGRGFVGRIYYAALYATPLTPAQVADHAAVLNLRDDR